MCVIPYMSLQNLSLAVLFLLIHTFPSKQLACNYRNQFAHIQEDTVESMAAFLCVYWTFLTTLK